MHKVLKNPGHTRNKVRKRAATLLPKRGFWAKQYTVAAVGVVLLLVAGGVLYGLAYRGGESHANTSLPFPGEGTVGHLADIPGVHTPVTLKSPVASLTTTHDGQVIEREDITGKGGLTVRHRNVVVRNSRMERIRVDNESYPNASVRVEWSTLGNMHGPSGPPEYYLPAIIRGSNVHVYRSEVFGGIDLVNLITPDAPHDVVVEENWLYGPYQQLNDRYQNTRSRWLSHSDGVQTQEGKRLHFLRNRWDLFLFQGYRWNGGSQPSGSGSSYCGNISKSGSCETIGQTKLSPAPTARDQIGVVPNINPLTTGMLFQQSRGTIEDVLIDGNYFDCDCYGYLSFTKGKYSQGPTNVRIVNNLFVKRYSTFGRDRLVGFDTPGNISWGNNIDENGNQISKPNSSMKSISVSGPTPLDYADYQPQRPDLIIESISWTPQNPKPGDEVTFSATVRNQGEAASPEGVPHKVLFLIGDESMWSDDVSTSLAPGAVRSQAANGGPVKATWTAGAGSFEVTAKLDNANLIPESDETNNTATAGLTVVEASGPLPGDVNGDGAVNSSDLHVILTHFGRSGMTKAQGDLDGNGEVGALDLSRVLANFSQ